MDAPRSDSDSNITDPHPDFLSPLAVTILHSRGDSAYRKLVVKEPTPREAKELLEGVQPSQLLNLPIKDAEEAQAVLAGLWLLHDGLDESHRLVQDLIGPTGAFWHAIMHRREGDFSNSKYWYDRCERHRCMRLLGAVATDVVGPEAAGDPLVQRVVVGDWNPRALVDLVQAVYKSHDDPRHDAAIRLQQIEWQTLFHHCVMQAVGAKGD